jgi:predicted nuclease of predicted toxin-antitoxin system
MRVLLDNCVPRSLGKSLPGHDIASATRQPWASLKDGPLLDAMEGQFDVLVTTDKSIPYQQNMKDRAVAVVILRAKSNTIIDLFPLVTELLAVLERIGQGEVVTVA